MRIIGNTLHALAAAAIIAAIWSPWHWQMAATAALLFLAGAMAHGSAQLTKAALDQPSSADGTGNSTGHHVHHTASTTRPTYGKQADQ